MDTDSREKASEKISIKNLSYATSLGALAGSPWLFQVSYSRGYDYFLWLYNAQILLDNLLRGCWPNWTSLSAAGHPLFKMGGLTDALIFSAFVGSLGYDLGPRLYVFMIYCVSAVGIYSMVRLWDVTHYSALVAVAAYVFSWFLTYTVDYTTYLSNFLLYALMPWGALCFVIALRRQSFGFLLLSSLLLFFAIGANAQVSIRVALFTVAAGLIDRGHKGCHNIKFFSYTISYLLMAASLAAFIIVPAIDLKFEVVQLASYRTNTWVSPWEMLFGLPTLGLYLIGRKLGFSIDVDPKFLASVVHSDYVGFTVLILAAFGIWYWRKDAVVRRILCVLSISLAIYWCVVPFLPNAAWIGSTHNWAVLHTFWFSFLVAFGVEYFIQMKIRYKRSKIFSALCIGFILVELGGARILLSHFALKHESPYRLPEVGIWEKLVDKIGPYERWFTFDLDHTHYLYPIMTANKPIANIIELRSRKVAYDSFLNHQIESIRRLDPTYKPSESLALLNARFIDLPIKTFSYRSDEKDYLAGINLLSQDPGLECVLKRPWHPLDEMYDASQPGRHIDRLFDIQKRNDYTQVVFRNKKSFWGFISNHTIAIVGDRLECERLFERITHFQDFKAERILYLLLTKEEYLSLETEVLSSIDAIIPLVNGINSSSPRIATLEDVIGIYQTNSHEMQNKISVERIYSGDEATAVRIGKRENDRFLFLSQQHFSHWFAFPEDSSKPLPVFTAGAGLTAIWVSSDTNVFEYGYMVPRNERLARAWSMLTILFCFVFAIVSRLRSRSESEIETKKTT
ncbi:MAG: hypothetical protein VX294_02650 [Candidatus Latescibacterota bacterium]|nr:hypothetical protein [Candidatus Latescibacterota bacterium]